MGAGVEGEEVLALAWAFEGEGDEYGFRVGETSVGFWVIGVRVEFELDGAVATGGRCGSVGDRVL